MIKLLTASDLRSLPDPLMPSCGIGSASCYLLSAVGFHIFRLGATLANGNRSEEAIAAYHTALRWCLHSDTCTLLNIAFIFRHSPGFIRCRYNLGISCVNLKAYKEAAEHFLTALNFQVLINIVEKRSNHGHDQQDAGRGPQIDQSHSAMSDSIWTSLRLAVSLMRRADLQPHLDAKNLDRLSREFNVEPQTQV